MEALIILGFFGTLCALVAYSKGRTPVGWFFLGFFFPLLALILIVCVSNLKEESEVRERSDREQRRLREQLRQEKMKNEAFRRHVGRRLDVHDAALNLETRSAGNLTSEDFSPDDPLDSPEDRPSSLRLPASGTERLWYVVQNGQELGPIKQSKLAHLIRSREVDASTLVWTKGMGERRPVAEIADLADLLDSPGTSRS